MLREVEEGLSRPQKELPPKYFYDHRGSELFEQITGLPEYYPTRTERWILERWMPRLVPALGVATAIELGAGSGAKTSIILDAMRQGGAGGHYVPLDVSARFLAQTAHRLRQEFPGLTVTPAVADISRELQLPADTPGPRLFVFLGSTLGNFAPTDAIGLLARIGQVMVRGDHLLLGVDLRKDPAVIEAAYNDAAGVTAEFNRNMLQVLNRELDGDFDVEAFDHRAFYHPTEHRIEMHLVARTAQLVHLDAIPPVRFAAGESVRTEISCKYDRPTLERMFSAAGLTLRQWRTDPADWFALAVGAPAR